MTGTPALLLDLDRTLIDVETYVDYCAALDELRSAHPDGPRGTTPDTTGWGTCTTEVIARLVGLAGTPLYADAAACVARHELAGAPEAQPMPGLAAFLAGIAHRPRAIVTLLGPEATELVVAGHDVAVDVVVPRRPDLRPKPFPDQVFEALRLLGAAPEDAVMIGDSATDFQAAQSAGVRFIGVTNGRATEEFGGTPAAESLLDVLELI